MANEINNHAVYEGASLMSYQILMNEDEQKQFFRNWITEKISDTRDIDFAEWQKEHSTREAYFFGPGQRKSDNINTIHFIGIIRISLFQYMYINPATLKKFIEMIKTKKVDEKALAYRSNRCIRWYTLILK